MSYQLIRNEISTMAVDAIVEIDDGVQQRKDEADLHIHDGFAISVARIGQISPSFAFIKPRKYMGHVIHAVGSRWGWGEWKNWEEHRVAHQQAKFYQDVLTTALQQGYRSVAVPILSPDSPDQRARQVAEETVAAFLQEYDRADTMQVYLVLPPFQDKSLFTKVNTYIDAHYKAPLQKERREKWSHLAELEEALDKKSVLTEADCQALAEAQQQVKDVYQQAETARKELVVCYQRIMRECNPPPLEMPPELHLKPKSPKETVPAPKPPQEDQEWLKEKPKDYMEEFDRVQNILKRQDKQLLPEVKNAIRNREEGFGIRLQKLIADKGMSNAECYKKAGLTRQLFGKICNNPSYNTTKSKILSITAGMKLSLEETEEVLSWKGMTFSNSSLFDVVVKSCIANGVFDLDEINAQLEAVGEQLLGSR